MKCELLFSYELESNYDIILQHLSKKSRPFRIICDDQSVHNRIKNEGFDSRFWNEIVPSDDGQIAKKAYQEAKELQRKILKIFEEIKFNKHEIIKGFDYSLLLQLNIFSKVKIILEEKIDTIFLFSGFFDIFFAILQYAKEQGYENDGKIRILKNNNIEFFDLQKYETSSQYQKEFSQKRIKKFVGSISGEKSLYKKSQDSFKLGKRLMSYLLNTISYKISKFYNKSSIEFILKKIDKKIKKKNTSYAFFVTTTREDLYLRPWYAVFEKLKKNKQDYLILTADLATTMLLAKEKINFISLFDEIKVLQRELVNENIGNNLKKQISEIISKNSNIIGLNELSKYLINQSIRSLALLIICEHIITKFSIKSTIAVADGEILENIALQISKKYKIANFSLLPAAVFPQPIFTDWFHANKIFVHGKEGLECLTSLGYDENKIILTGNPRYDYIKNISTNDSKKRLENEYKIESSKKLVVIAMSRYHKDDEIWMSKLIKFANRNNFEIVIKIHPMYKRNLEEDALRLKKIKSECQQEKFLISYDMDIMILLSASDVVITDYSNVGMEAIYLQKPLISVAFEKEAFDDANIHYQDFGASLFFNEYSKLEEGILEILQSQKHIQTLKNGQQKFIERFNFKNDNNASERIFNHISESVIERKD